MAKNNNLQDYLKDLYEGISSRKPSASKDPQKFRQEIENLVFTGDADAVAADIRLNKTAYVNDVKLTGTIEDYNDEYDTHTLVGDSVEITENGTYNVSPYVNATVRVANSDKTYWQEFISSISSMNSFFENSTLTNVDWYFKDVDFTNITQINKLFKNSKVKSVELNFPNATDWSNVFANCNSLTTVKINSPIASCSNMFGTDCGPLKELDLYSLTGEIPKLYSATALRKVVVRNCSSSSSLGSIFGDQYSYRFSGATNSIYNPEGIIDGRFYVPDELYGTFTIGGGGYNAAYNSCVRPLSELANEGVLRANYPTVSISNVTTTYGFKEIGDGWYESTNKRKPSSYAICNIKFTVPAGAISKLIRIYVETDAGIYRNEHYGIISELDQTLNKDNGVDVDSRELPTEGYVTFIAETEGEHFVQIKYRHQTSSKHFDGNDCIRFKVLTMWDGMEEWLRYDHS
jgi:hypothetical protein